MAGDDGNAWDGFSDDDVESLWGAIPGVPFLDPYEQDYARELFERGFIDRDIDPDSRMEARDEFFDFTGLGYYDDEGLLHADLFPWDEWRELMGYE